MADDSEHFRDVVAEVAASYFSNTHVTVGDIPQVISQIAASLASVSLAKTQDQPAEDVSAPKAEEQTKLTTRQIRASIQPDALISFEDGRPYKTLRRHLTVKGMTPQQYREKWGLPSDYPMVAASYSEARSAMAKSLGLGQMGRKAKAAPAPAEPKRRRGRAAKTDA